MWIGGLLGYFAPNVYLSRRIAGRQVEHRAGFPDFMDLLVVCADAGLSMEAALDRVGRELADSYRSLSANVHMATLEMRAGRTLSETLDHLADRLGLEEARSFATLLQQSEKLGSSLTEALRVYSDDMRHKRLSRAEEKAYSLPAKLSVPLTLCVFPVVIIVIMLPVYVKLKMCGSFLRHDLVRKPVPICRDQAGAARGRGVSHSASPISSSKLIMLNAMPVPKAGT